MNYFERQLRFSGEAADAFSFFTGNSFLFMIDYSNDSRIYNFASAKTNIWLTGDMHLDNFGTLSTSVSDGNTCIWDVNDFDESVIFDYKFDVWRLATSLMIVNSQQTAATLAPNYSPSKAPSAMTVTPTAAALLVMNMTQAYYNSIARAALNSSEIYRQLNYSFMTTNSPALKYYTGPTPSPAPNNPYPLCNHKSYTTPTGTPYASNPTPSPLDPVFKLMCSVTSGPVPSPNPTDYTRAGSDGLDDYSYLNGSGIRQFNITTNDHIAVPTSVFTSLQNALPTYVQTLANNAQNSNWDFSAYPSYFTLKDLIQSVNEGGGSLGSIRYWALIEGPSATDQYDDRILDIKFQNPPDGYGYINSTLQFTIQNATQFNDGWRETIAYRSMVNYADPLAGWMTISGLNYSVRERHPCHNSIDYTPTNDLSSDLKSQNGAVWYGDALATAHARADKDSPWSLIDYDFDASLFAILSQNFSGWQAEVLAVASEAYAQNTDDYNAFVQLYNSGVLNYTLSPSFTPSLSPTSTSPSSAPTTSAPVTTSAPTTSAPVTSAPHSNNGTISPASAVYGATFAGIIVGCVAGGVL